MFEECFIATRHRHQYGESDILNGVGKFHEYGLCLWGGFVIMDVFARHGDCGLSIIVASGRSSGYGSVCVDVFTARLGRLLWLLR